MNYQKNEKIEIKKKKNPEKGVEKKKYTNQKRYSNR